MINTPNAVDRYQVVGNPIAQSKSPFIHTLFAAQTGQQLEYGSACPAIDEFKAAAQVFFAAGGKGMNITAPFKLEAFELAQALSARAQFAGAVNTLKLTEDGEIFGDNTDGFGLVYDLSERLNWPLAGANVLVLGAGGAVRGVMQPLLAANPAKVVVANRTLARAENLVALFGGLGNIEAVSFDDLSLAGVDVIINGTSAGLSGGLPPLPANQLSTACRCYDMTYSAGPTVFQAWARREGAAQAVDGLGMLVAQAAESFRLWRGVMPAIEPVLAKVRASLA
ncbi:shikimate dehydrogenase [Simiduia sp. 21SJ11W-1]|uniref:shikimate dehydrogenase n=1 Tax=Simiduia sp. 21SJ11W-1 TaxID=2909669 RepID=UPI0020A09CE7|nr:shikimate dehydrogenase [Simiduia sp. 21SJ11W-1]UTA47917.1 shikimate dehydrogenase [Simiduia sp. 21SJ11W-1]